MAYTGSCGKSSPEGPGGGLAAENSIKFRRRSKFEALKARREEARQQAEVCSILYAMYNAHLLQ